MRRELDVLEREGARARAQASDESSRRDELQAELDTLRFVFDRGKEGGGVGGGRKRARGGREGRGEGGRDERGRKRGKGRKIGISTRLGMA